MTTKQTGHTPFTEKVMEANEILIVKQKNLINDLWKALKMVGHIDHEGEVCWCDEEIWDYRAHGKHCEYCNRAKQAISKAQGETR